MIAITLKSSLLIAVIFAVRLMLGKRLSPAMRHAIWGLVPLHLLLCCFTIPSPLSFENLYGNHKVDHNEPGTERSAVPGPPLTSDLQSVGYVGVPTPPTAP